MIKYNIEQLWQTVKKQCEIWAKLPITLCGRIAIVKMNILPRFLFFSTTLNVTIPIALINKIQSTTNKFIWNHKPPRIKATIMQQQIREGGLAVTSFLNYYRAAHLTVVSQWWNAEEDRTDSWWLEQATTAIPLKEWVFLPKQERLKAQLSNNWIRTSLSKMWDKIRDIIAPGISPISSYYYHSLFNEVTKAT